MIPVTIRPATEADRALLRPRWIRTLTARRAAPADMLSLGGGRSIAAGLWHAMAERLVDDLLPRSAVLVADLATVPGEPVGWIAWEPDELVAHMVSVLGVEVQGRPGLRRRGLGSMLLEAAVGLDVPRASFLTPAGAALLEAHRQRGRVAA